MSDAQDSAIPETTPASGASTSLQSSSVVDLAEDVIEYETRKAQAHGNAGIAWTNASVGRVRQDQLCKLGASGAEIAFMPRHHLFDGKKLVIMGAHL